MLLCSFIQAVCETVQSRLILAIDRKLYERLTSLRIVPTIYVMKWARLMFLREFPVEDVSVIWDFLLWEIHRGASLLRCIENLGAAMVYFVREYLLNPRVRKWWWGVNLVGGLLGCWLGGWLVGVWQACSPVFAVADSVFYQLDAYVHVCVCVCVCVCVYAYAIDG